MPLRNLTVARIQTESAFDLQIYWFLFEWRCENWKKMSQVHKKRSAPKLMQTLNSKCMSVLEQSLHLIVDILGSVAKFLVEYLVRC